MHMADSFISPLVGGAMLTVTSVITAYSSKKINIDLDEKKIPLMGIMGAFVFAAQMINFTIPGTGSSGHLGGGLLLAILLGSYSGFLTMASILLIQALFFGDGGLLAYGCNVFNLGFYTCFIAYPLVYKLFIRKGITTKRIFTGSIIASIAGLQLGAFSVVVETLLSGKTEILFKEFVIAMQFIHLAIGLVEGLVTAAVVTFIWQARPEVIEKADTGEGFNVKALKGVLIALVICAVLIGGILSWFASTHPDGLEWSLEKTVIGEAVPSQSSIYETLADLQSKTAILPDYGFKKASNSEADAQAAETWPSVNIGTSVSGVAGGILTLALASLTGLVITLIKRRKRKIIA